MFLQQPNPASKTLPTELPQQPVPVRYDHCCQFFFRGKNSMAYLKCKSMNAVRVGRDPFARSPDTFINQTEENFVSDHTFQTPAQSPAPRPPPAAAALVVSGHQGAWLFKFLTTAGPLFPKLRCRQRHQGVSSCHTNCSS